VAVLALAPANVDMKIAPDTAPAQADSAYRWTVGWPQPDWMLRHEVRLATPLAGVDASLSVPLAIDYGGTAQVLITVNGRDLGPMMQPSGRELRTGLPPDVIAGQTRLTFELRQRPWDPAMRLFAQPWTSGATMGALASSFHDGVRWWPGTFNDGAARHQFGVYIVRLG
jgi:hypothetical protein